MGRQLPQRARNRNTARFASAAMNGDCITPHAGCALPGRSRGCQGRARRSVRFALSRAGPKRCGRREPLARIFHQYGWHGTALRDICNFVNKLHAAGGRVPCPQGVTAGPSPKTPSSHARRRGRARLRSTSPREGGNALERVQAPKGPESRSMARANRGFCPAGRRRGQEDPSAPASTWTDVAEHGGPTSQATVSAVALHQVSAARVRERRAVSRCSFIFVAAGSGSRERNAFRIWRCWAL